MNFRREKIRDYFLHDTHVENIFINEYMAGAPGEYVKVYLFALMYAGYDLEMNNETIAKHLNMAIEDVLKAWTYWSELGIVRKHYPSPKDKLNYEIEFLDLKARIYGMSGLDRKNETDVPDEVRDFLSNEEIRSMYKEIERITGRVYQGREPEEIRSWITDYNATPQVIVYAYSYCQKTKKQSNPKYVGAVVKKWTEQGLKTIEQVEKFLEETDNRHYLYKRILKALGFLRNPTEGEMVIIDTWFDELKFDMDTVLAACNKTTGISNPNINYINSVLKAWHSGEQKTNKNSYNDSNTTAKNGGSNKPNQISRVMQLYEETRLRHEREAESRRNEVYQRIPRIKDIDEETRSAGMRISKIMLSGAGNAKAEIKNIRKRTEELNHEKAFLLTENNFRIDYMDITYDCPQCKDTGTLDSGERCSCFAKRLEEVQKMV